MFKVIFATLLTLFSLNATAWNSVGDKQAAFGDTQQTWVFNQYEPGKHLIMFNVHDTKKCTDPVETLSKTNIMVNNQEFKVDYYCTSKGDYNFSTDNEDTFMGLIRIFYSSHIILLSNKERHVDAVYYPERIWDLQ